MDFSQMSDFKIKNLEILNDFDTFCKENNIKYNISSGTALGAVRHGGFIPWDDDIDVDMHINEFKKFEKIWKKKGNKEKYFLQTKSSEPNLTGGFFRIRMNNTTCMLEREFNISMHLGIPLDIFPYFNAPKSRFFQKIIKFFYDLSEKFASLNARYYKLNKFFKISTVFITNLLFSIVCLISELSSKSGVIYYPSMFTNKDLFFDKSYLEPPKPIDFENLNVMGPNKNHEYLNWAYGNYMELPPEDKRCSHGVWILDTENDYREYLKGNLPLPK